MTIATFIELESGPQMAWHRVFIESDKMPPDFKGKITLAGFASRSDAERYAAEWRQDELAQFKALSEEMRAMPFGMGRMPISNKIEKIRDAVQKRTGIKDS